ncbi:sterol regulatory element-binding protein cleavage-activating protein-like [Ruditapes philippinarum]|uniref:sterol regulatory element-binding protein cleavage-activating protein-like n=1 Tax=Ruditapes philippinarum TaxID=129788 RepID=UPI00295B4038|nr:sterol regulatory element-binding protein cleavage-activating protein-like [Ruditapes philippinarum]XP_060568694.1 sterol regulatory element-binding protein cleavage-activating protein-like [Ruditapes philippinarum]
MKAIKDLVSQVFYTHGLLCASHPFSILVSVCAVIIILCYPLLYVPLPGNIPGEYVTSVKNYKVPPKAFTKGDKSFDTTDITSIPRWYKGPSQAYIQQLVVKTTVSPWEPTQHDPLDALYAPLTKVFKILEEVEKLRHQHGEEEKSLVNCCLRVSEPLRSKYIDKLLPEYACLVLSPANLWQKNLNRFLEDKEVLRTIYKRYNQALDAPPGIRDVLFGLPWKQTGISRYFIRNRQRTISFAITLVLKKYDESFVGNLRTKLETVYPDTVLNVNNSHIDHIVHLHYKDINIYFEYIHLIVLYLVLLMYLYFSVKKIEMVKSKWGLAFSAVVTVVSSLLISVSVCSIFGLNTRLNGGEIFPYLVVLIGVENVLVMTKSVVSTSVELDVKYRVATGLSKEGWYITKNLLIELVIIMVGFFTFVPAIQEFCLFALVGLLTDFTLQMVFFVTVLSVDIRRMELSDLHKHKQDTSTPSDLVQLEPLFKCPFKTSLPTDRVRLQPRFNLSTGMGMISSRGTPVSPRVQHEERLFQRESFLDLPRRLRLLYFWASTRVVQRFIMVCSVVWIILIVYKTGLVHHITNTSFSINGTVIPDSVDDLEQMIKLQEQTTTADQNKINVLSPLAYFWQQDDEDLGSVKHTDLELWRKLSHVHWVTMFNYYNISIVGKYISILPSIHLSIIIPPEEAIRLRVPGYKTNWPQNEAKETQIRPKIPEIHLHEKSRDKNEPKEKITIQSEETKEQPHENGNIHISGSEQYRKTTQEPEFLSEEYLRKYYPYIDPDQLRQYYPKSRSEFIITISLVFLSVICITYFILTLYRCMCSKKYSKWRASWNKIPKNSRGNSYYKQIKEAVPIILKGHLQEIECLIIDGSVIISSCLGGQLRVWDSITGECLHTMQRKSATPPMRRKPCEGRNVNDSEADLYAEYHGNNGNQSTFSVGLDLSNNSDDQPRPRLRRISGRSETEQNVSQSKEIFEDFPDLKNTIDYNFSKMYRYKNSDVNVIQSAKTESKENTVGEVNESTGKKGYDFQQQFGELYNEHSKFLEEKRIHDENKRQYLELSHESRASRSKSWSEGDHTLSDTSMNDSSNLELAPSPIWCLACRGNVVIAGCGNGKIEFWDSTTGALKCLYGESDVGVTGINFIGKKVIVARLDGSIDFLELETFQNPRISTPLSPSSLNKKIKGHSRHLSHTRTGSDDLRLWDEVIHCTQVQHTQAHHRPITVLLTEGGRIVSASQDFTLKVFRLEDYRCLYTLHGHTGAITCLYLDKCAPYAAVSGSADGTIRLWDLLTGHCVHKVIGHEGTIVGLTCTDTYIISSGLDDKMCVWDRKRGQLLYSVEMETSCGSSMSMLCKNFLVTGGQGSLYLWDVHKGELVRVVNLEQRDRTAFIHHIQAMENSTIICDYGKDIKVIHFPLVLEKRD